MRKMTKTALQIANCKFQIEQRRSPLARLVLPVLKFAICNLQFAIFLVLVCGCGDMEATHKAPQAPPPTATQPSGQASYMSKDGVRGADKDGEDLPSIAMQYLQKYSDAQEKLVKLQQDNRELTDRELKLGEQNAKLQADLAASQGQLKDANAMLLEMRQELEKWKTNVLGYRQEMRDSQQAQLAALSRILKLLGGEVPPASSQPATEPAGAEPRSKP